MTTRIDEVLHEEGEVSVGTRGFYTIVYRDAEDQFEFSVDHLTSGMGVVVYLLATRAWEQGKEERFDRKADRIEKTIDDALRAKGYKVVINKKRTEHQNPELSPAAVAPDEA